MSNYTLCTVCGNDYVPLSLKGSNLCSQCFDKAYAIWLAKGSTISFSDAKHILESKIITRVIGMDTGSDSEFKTKEAIQITSPLSSDEYDSLEYDVVGFEESVLFFNMQDKMNYLEQLFEAATIGKDIDWMKELHEQKEELKKQFQ